MITAPIPNASGMAKSGNPNRLASADSTSLAKGPMICPIA